MRNATSPSQGPSPVSPLPALTGIRFLAAMQVVFFHYGAGFADRHRFPSPLRDLLHAGWVAVALFFILSGFILSYAHRNNPGGTRNRRSFWVARFARIYPVYFLSLLLDLPFTSARLPAKLSTLAMVQSWNPVHPEWAQQWNAPTWTLSCEAFFYLLFPFILPALQKLSTRILESVSVCLVLLIVFAHTMTNWPAAWTQILPIPTPVIRLPEFLLGMSAGILFVRHRRYGLSGTPAVVSAILAILTIEIVFQGAWISLVVIPYISLIYALACGGNYVSRLLSTPSLVLLGGASYAIYLLQVPVRLWSHFFISGHSRVDGIDVFGSPVLLIALSCLVYSFFEEPARKWIRRRFARTPHSTPAPLTETFNQTETS